MEADQSRRKRRGTEEERRNKDPIRTERDGTRVGFKWKQS